MVQSMNIAMENQNEDVEEKVIESPKLQNEMNGIEVGKKGEKEGIKEDGEHRVEKGESSTLRPSIPRSSKTNHRIIPTVNAVDNGKRNTGNTGRRVWNISASDIEGYDSSILPDSEN
ncbi:hypothetical protein Bca52824_073717 [Brassica carinata]|uniref:Uncharacterized protein n=1 Tax=Brassica carinata TaxID=52824 RepID=A0A8X7QBK2_BRACI|nr:hypothetical protein Bca52824_073717 [Brassica carinata]